MKTSGLYFKTVFLLMMWYPVSLVAQEDRRTPGVFGLNPVGPSSSEVCRKCHEDIYNTWANSMHFQSYSDPVFQIAFLEAQVKRGEGIRKFCLRCHTPFVQLNDDYNLRSAITMEGVSCDFCHSIVKVNINNMDVPYEFNVGAQKYGPIKDATSPAHETYYSELHTRSEFCGGCHQLINEHGVEIMGTYTEWSEGPYVKDDIHCQNCHMPIEFDLKVVKPEIKKVDHYVTAHKFQGGHSQINVKNAASVRVLLRRRAAEALVSVSVTNEESGHKIPTGTPARKIVLSVQLEDENGKSIGEESRTYQKVLVDQNGQVLVTNASQILDAVRILSDNRIAPKETRRENFSFTIPEGIQKITARAELRYIYETPILQKALMSVEMASAVATHHVRAPEKKAGWGITILSYKILFALLLALIILGAVIFHLKRGSSKA